MKIVLASDHAGYVLKEAIKQYLQSFEEYTVEDLGTHNEESVHYPDYGAKVARAVSSGKADRGIIICGTGIGISIAANRFKKVRAALCSDPYTAMMSRKHNDANVLALGSRTTLLENALTIVGLWLHTQFDGGRHEQRVQMLDKLS